MTQREIAQLAGPDISYSWVSKFCTGALNNPSVRSLMALESALDRVSAP